MSTFTPINESKSLISLKKVSESTVSSTRKNGKKTQSTSIITQNSPHQRNNRIPLLTFSTLSNQRNTTLSTTFYQSTFTIPRLDLKIKQANENKKMKTMMKNEKNIKEIQARHEKLMQYKLKRKASKEEQKENQHRLDQMRKLKLKIFNILSRDTHSVCDDFQRKVNAFNIKLFEFLGGNFMKNQALKYNATFRFDKNEHGYYDVISALQKSIRGSDVNASLHYLARLIEADNLDIILRRLAVIVYEDIGLANPMMGPKVMAAISSAQMLGLPEARIPLAEIVIELALSPKSNSAEMAIDLALNEIRSKDVGSVPKHLHNGNPDYLYPHNYKNDYVKQQYLPDNIKNSTYYYPKPNKNEIILKDVMDKLSKM